MDLGVLDAGPLGGLVCGRPEGGLDWKSGGDGRAGSGPLSPVRGVGSSSGRVARRTDGQRFYGCRIYGCFGSWEGDRVIPYIRFWGRVRERSCSNAQKLTSIFREAAASK
ncbi:hypothetical protein GCM10027570_52690 [Streptomonospora sediminis]